MLTAAFRDLVWRRKRFAIALAATALVMAMSLMMSGLSASFPNEIDRMVDRLGGEQFLATAGANGPFYPGSVLLRSGAPAESSGVLFATATVNVGGDIQQVTVLGVEPGGLGDPSADDGHSLGTIGDTVASSELGVPIGETVTVAGVPLTVQGTLDETTLFSGQPTLFVTLAQAQQMFAGGQDVATFLLVPPGTAVPAGFASFDAAEAKADLLRPLGKARDSIMFVTVLLWAVAACIVGSVVFLSAMERTRDFAVFKATGTSSWAIAGGLLLQAVLLTVVASLLAIVLAIVLAPRFPAPVEIPLTSMVRLPLLAVGVGALASLVGLRRMLSVEPAMAFGGAS